MSDVQVARRPDHAAKGRAVHQALSAHRAVDDPVKLGRAARIVRAALARRKLTLDELTPLEIPERRPA